MIHTLEVRAGLSLSAAVIKPGILDSISFSLYLLATARRLCAAPPRLPALPFLRLHGLAPGSVGGGREPLFPLVQTRQAGHGERAAG